MGKTSNLTIPCLSVKIHTSRSSFGFNQAASRMDPLRPAPVTVLQLFNNKYLLLFKVKKSDNYNFPSCIKHYE